MRCATQRSLLPLIGMIALGLTDLALSKEIDFAKDVQTLLARRCYACHGPDLQESGLRFDDRNTLLAEADSGLRSVIPGKSGESEFIRRITSEDESERMPPEGKPLTEEEVDSLRAWIDQGAEYTQHWAFQPIQNPALPSVQDPGWCSVSLDRFVLNKLESANLAPVTKASPTELIRRVYLDVTGLPPTPETVAELTADWNATSYQRLVDRLLANPALGEKWARAWLDVVRFAETNSYERDGAKPNAWKYRDYVIRAMNDGKPYDQFVREQIAGDELDEVTAESLTATGYYRLGLWDDEPADPKQAIFDGFDDLITTTSQGFLGLTLNCARCHDHKIDPLTQSDYYSLVAFMRDVTPYASRGDEKSFSQIILDSELAAKHNVLREQKRSLEGQLRTIEQEGIKKMPAPDQRATEGPGRKKLLREKLAQYLDSGELKRYQEIQTKVKELAQQERHLPPIESVLGLAKLNSDPAATHILLRGSPHNEGDEVEPAFPKLLGGGTPEIPQRTAESRSAGRRRLLADWLASKDNWMTARVIVNRIWLHYFGRGIVRSPNNFGLMGDPPTHPELIDHLATELIRDDWQLKRLHRKILLSSTYQLSSRDNTAAAAQDPANDLFWRQNLRRLSAEQIRDSVLAVTGQLNTERYGKSIFPTLSAEVLASQSRPGSGWGKSSDAQQSKRSIYIHVKRSLPVPMLSAFDFPETDISCEARFLTTQPGQALSMLNGAWMQLQAGHMLARVEREVGQDLSRQATRCLELTLGKVPQEQDVSDLVDLVHRLQEKHGLDEPQARHAMCLVCLNLNEFLYLD